MNDHLWYEILEDGTIGRSCNDEEWARELGLVLETDRKIVSAYNGKRYFEDECPVRPVSVVDYDNAMEEHLKEEQTARGYTTRSPSEYSNSTNARWKQDAADWVAHITTVMEYALEIENLYERGETVPTLAEFKAALPKIVWTVDV